MEGTQTSVWTQIKRWCDWKSSALNTELQLPDKSPIPSKYYILPTVVAYLATTLADFHMGVFLCTHGRYRDGVDEKDQLIQWLWETLTSFTNEEKTLFLRFVSGRSRLPARVSEIPQRFQIIKWGRVSLQLTCTAMSTVLFILCGGWVKLFQHYQCYF